MAKVQKVAKATDPSQRVRFPDSLKKKIEKSAGVNARSFNSEVIVRLATTFE